MGVRLYPFKFNIDGSDNLSFIFEDADETVDHILINDPDVERDTNCKGLGISTLLQSVNKSESQPSQTIPLYDTLFHHPLVTWCAMLT